MGDAIWRPWFSLTMFMNLTSGCYSSLSGAFKGDCTALFLYRLQHVAPSLTGCQASLISPAFPLRFLFSSLSTRLLLHVTTVSYLSVPSGDTLIRSEHLRRQNGLCFLAISFNEPRDAWKGPLSFPFIVLRSVFLEKHRFTDFHLWLHEIDRVVELDSRIEGLNSLQTRNKR